MRYIEKVSKNIDKAVEEALVELNAKREDVEVEVIEKGSNGFFGLGAKQAKVKVTLKQKDDLSEDNNINEGNTIDQTKVSNENKVSNEITGVENNKISNETDEVIKRAEDFLRKLFKEMLVECTIDSAVSNDNRININLVGKNMGVVIGKRGETLDAIQYITNIVANKGRQDYIKVMIDTENYRARREETLKKLAFKLSKKVNQTLRPVSLEPMNPYDRRIIHSALQDSKYVKTHSEGKEPYRRVVITPEKQYKYSK